LLAVGGDLDPQRLLNAYRSGIFPWYSNNQPILWWSPNPRAVVFHQDLKVSRSLKKTIRKTGFEIKYDENFPEVIRACAAPRDGDSQTWITPEMINAYQELHQAGWAHSVETYLDGALVGGLYGISIGSLFFGESMFTRVTDASKVAFATMSTFLHSCGYPLIDCQVPNPHLTSLGSTNISRKDFLQYIEKFIDQKPEINPWEAPWPRPIDIL